MDNIDPALAQRVWQRVQGAEPTAPATAGPDPADLTALIAGEAADAAACLRLSRELGGRGGTLLQLAREDQSHAGCLRGICAVLTGKTPQVPISTPAPGPAAAILRRCYTNHLHRLREYDRHAGDRDFGPAFEKLAAEERTHCKLLLELLGTLNR